MDERIKELIDYIKMLQVVLKVTHGEHRVKRSWNRNFEYVLDVGIPKINPKYIGTYDTNLHEEMHFLDTTATPEVEVEDNASPTISEVESRVHRLGNVRALTRAEVDDQATEKVERITQRIKDLTKKVCIWSICGYYTE